MPQTPYQHIIAASIERHVEGFSIAEDFGAERPLVYVNHGFEQMTGYKREEVVGKSCRFLQGPETDADAVAMLRANLNARRPCTATLRNYRKNGEAFWNRLSLYPVQSHGQSYFVGIQSDLSLLLRAEHIFETTQAEQELGPERLGNLRNVLRLMHDTIGNALHNLQSIRMELDARGAADASMLAHVDQVLADAAAIALHGSFHRDFSYERCDAVLSAHPPSMGTGPILIVEDNNINRMILKRIVEKEGHTTMVAEDGAQAVTAFTEHAERGDVAMVLMDIQMPNMNGLDAARAIRSYERLHGHMPRPIVAVTAHNLPEDREAALAAGMNDVVTKPFKPAQIVELLTRFSAQRQAS